MARQKERIYKRRRPLRTLLRVLGVALLTFVVLAVTIFFVAQRYIVYTPDGVRLDIPILRDILDDIPESAQREPILPEPEHPPGDPAEEDLEPREPTLAAFIQGTTLTAIPDWAFALRGVGANAMLAAVSDEHGRLSWETGIELAIRFDLAGEGLIAPRLETLDEDNHSAALLYGFSNQFMAQRNPDMALTTGWLDPANEEVRAYIMDLALELATLGFDEIVLSGFTFPPNSPVADGALILSFLTELALALGAVGTDLSLMTLEEHWHNPEGERLPLYPDLGALSHIVFQFYCVLTPETLEYPERFAALMQAVESTLGRGSAHRFLPGGLPLFPDLYEEEEFRPLFPQKGNWFLPLTLDEIL